MSEPSEAKKKRRKTAPSDTPLNERIKPSTLFDELLKKDKLKKDKLKKDGQISLDEFSAKRRSAKVKARGALFLGGTEDSWRFAVVWAVIALVAIVLVVRAFYVQVVNSAFYTEKGNDFITSQRDLPVRRGMIKDTLGYPLAGSAPLVTVIFSPYDYAQSYYDAKKDLKNAKSEKGIKKAQAKLDEMNLKRLSDASGYSLEALQQAVKIQEDIDVFDAQAVSDALPRQKGSRRLVLANRVTPEEVAWVSGLDFVAVYEEPSTKRFYPQAETHAQVLGYMASNNTDGLYKGRSGIEAKYETLLSGSAGQVLVLKSAKQKAINQITQLRPEIAGQDVVLTIDSRLQYMLYKELERVGREQSALWASGIIVEVGTGDVLAMGSWPSFNSNDLNRRSSVAERNRVLLDTFEPGSVMKAFTVAAALESGKYNTNTLIETSPGSIKVGGHTIRDSGNYGAITLGKLIQKSSNVASTKIALHLPNEAIVDMQRAFGFGQKTAINFKGEQAGVLKTPHPNNIANRATLSYGYGQAVTLAQVAQAYAALGSGGVLHPLRLVKNEEKMPSRQVISTKNAKAIVEMMELVTLQGGTGRAAAIDGYRVAGKTGTSRRSNPDPNIQGYLEGQYRALFAGVAPVSNPRFAVAILVENPKEQFGGKVAAPVFSRVMGEALRLYDVPYDKPLKDTQAQSPKNP